MDSREKMRTKYHFHRPGVDAFNTAKIGHGNSQKPQVRFIIIQLYTIQLYSYSVIQQLYSYTVIQGSHRLSKLTYALLAHNLRLSAAEPN